MSLRRSRRSTRISTDHILRRGWAVKGLPPSWMKGANTCTSLTQIFGRQCLTSLVTRLTAWVRSESLIRVAFSSLSSGEARHCMFAYTRLHGSQWRRHSRPWYGLPSSRGGPIEERTFVTQTATSTTTISITCSWGVEMTSEKHNGGEMILSGRNS